VVPIGREVDQPSACRLLKRVQPARKIVAAALCDYGEPLRPGAAERADALLEQIVAVVPHAGIKIDFGLMQRGREANHISTGEFWKGLIERCINAHAGRARRAEAKVELAAALPAFFAGEKLRG